MNLKTLLDLQRAYYVDHLVMGIDTFPDGEAEKLLALDFPAPDELYRSYRIDMTHQVGPDVKWTEFTLEEPFEHETYVQRENDIVVQVEPFPWNRCLVEALTDRFDRGALIGWGTHWIDVDDVKQRDADGLKGVIHHISPPSYPLGKLTFVVDFGSAPVQAVTELIQILTIGAKKEHITLMAFTGLED